MIKKITVAISVITLIISPIAADIGMPQTISIEDTYRRKLPIDKYRTLNVRTFILPESMGTITDRFSGTSDRVIFHIQDAHCAYDAEKKISEIIGYLNGEYGIYAVDLEGGKGGYDLSMFTDIADPRIRRKISDFFLKEGLMNGAEDFAVNNPEKAGLWGVESAELYLSNLEAYRDHTASRPGLMRHLRVIDRALRRIKKHVYSRELQAMDGQCRLYDKGQIGLEMYLRYLVMKALDKGIDLERFPNVSILKDVISDEAGMDFKKVNDEKETLLEDMGKRLSRTELDELVAKATAFKLDPFNQSVFYAYLGEKALSLGIGKEALPDLFKYLEYSRKYESTDRTALMVEIKELKNAVCDTLFTGGRDREIAGFSEALALFKALIEVKLTREEFGKFDGTVFREEIVRYARLIREECLSSGMKDMSAEILALEPYLDRMLAFYGISFRRDEAFLDNMRFRELPGVRGRNAVKGAILMTGGFHSENLSDLMRERGISYISIMPSFNEEGERSNYYTLLSGGKSPYLGSIKSALSMIMIASLCNELGMTVHGYEFRQLAGIAVEALERVYLSGKAEAYEVKGEGRDGYIVFDVTPEGPLCYFTDTKDKIPSGCVVRYGMVFKGDTQSLINALSSDSVEDTEGNTNIAEDEAKAPHKSWNRLLSRIRSKLAGAILSVLIPSILLGSFYGSVPSWGAEALGPKQGAGQEINGIQAIEVMRGELSSLTDEEKGPLLDRLIGIVENGKNEEKMKAIEALGEKGKYLDADKQRKIITALLAVLRNGEIAHAKIAGKGIADVFENLDFLLLMDTAATDLIVDDLEKGLVDGPENRRVLFIEAYGKFGGKMAVYQARVMRTLLKLAMEGTSGPNIKGAVFKILYANIDNVGADILDNKVVGELIKCMGGDDIRVRLSAVYILGKIGSNLGLENKDNTTFDAAILTVNTPNDAASVTKDDIAKGLWAYSDDPDPKMSLGVIKELSKMSSGISVNSLPGDVAGKLLKVIGSDKDEMVAAGSTLIGEYGRSSSDKEVVTDRMIPALVDIIRTRPNNAKTVPVAVKSLARIYETMPDSLERRLFYDHLRLKAFVADNGTGFNPRMPVGHLLSVYESPSFRAKTKDMDTEDQFAVAFAAVGEILDKNDAGGVNEENISARIGTVISMREDTEVTGMEIIGPDQEVYFVSHASDDFKTEYGKKICDTLKAGKAEYYKGDQSSPRKTREMKEKFFSDLRVAGPEMVFVFDGHGDEDHLWLRDLTPEEKADKANIESASIGWKELGDQLIAWGSAQDEYRSDRHIAKMVLFSCDSGGFTSNLRAYLAAARKDAATNVIPLVVTATNEGNVGVGVKDEPMAMMNALFRVTGGKGKFTVADALKLQKEMGRTETEMAGKFDGKSGAFAKKMRWIAELSTGQEINIVVPDLKGPLPGDMRLSSDFLPGMGLEDPALMSDDLLTTPFGQGYMAFNALGTVPGVVLNSYGTAGAIGKMTDIYGNVLTGGFVIIETNGKITVTNSNAEMLPIEVPLSKDGAVEKRDFIKGLYSYYETRKKNISPEVTDLVTVSVGPLLSKLEENIDEITLIEHNPGMKGMISEYRDGAGELKKRLYLDKQLAVNPLALIHELGEGFIEIPGGWGDDITKHTFLRGAGRDVRIAYNENVIKTSDIEEDLITEIEMALEKLAKDGRVSAARKVNKERNGTFMTASERSLIRSNYKIGLKGKRALFGLEDHLDPAGNARFTEEISIMNRDLRQNVLNIFLMPCSPRPGFDTKLTNNGNQMEREYRKKYGNNTEIYYYGQEYDEKEFLDRLEEAFKKAVPEDGKSRAQTEKLFPKIFVYCPTPAHVSSLGRFLEDKKRQRPDVDLDNLFLTGKDTLEQDALVDEVKVLSVGTLIMNDKRLRSDFKLAPDNELIVGERKRMLRFFGNNGICGLSEEDNIEAMLPEELEQIMVELCKGIRALEITKIDWENFRDWKDAQDEVLRSL
ncbi:MAG: hypothetical protein HQL30_07465 [Candidatus Omnitrophica bacterium]|nr:hypothetical protein [Candidatus Omnitrophota bacterium]